MRHIVDIVDSREYANSNCFVHQLTKEIENVSEHLNESEDLWVETMSLQEFLFRRPKADQFLSRLKQRTLRSQIQHISSVTQDKPIVIYDQDPWEAYRDDSPYKGSYELFCNELNVKNIAVTTKWWADFLNSKNIPCEFVKMGVLPQYCDVGKQLHERSTITGFIGSIHGYRKQLFDDLKNLGVNVEVRNGGLGYNDYLNSLSNLAIFIHREDYEFTVDGTKTNLDVGLWIKDIEAAARGCFTIRNKGADSQTYLEGLRTTYLYNHVNEIPDIINTIMKIDIEEKQTIQNEAVEQIKMQNFWYKTALDLVI